MTPCGKGEGVVRQGGHLPILCTRTWKYYQGLSDRWIDSLPAKLKCDHFYSVYANTICKYSLPIFKELKSMGLKVMKNNLPHWEFLQQPISDFYTYIKADHWPCVKSATEATHENKIKTILIETSDICDCL